MIGWECRAAAATILYLIMDGEGYTTMSQTRRSAAHGVLLASAGCGNLRLMPRDVGEQATPGRSESGRGGCTVLQSELYESRGRYEVMWRRERGMPAEHGEVGKSQLWDTRYRVAVG